MIERYCLFASIIYWFRLNDVAVHNCDIYGGKYDIFIVLVCLCFTSILETFLKCTMLICSMLSAWVDRRTTKRKINVFYYWAVKILDLKHLSEQHLSEVYHQKVACFHALHHFVIQRKTSFNINGILKWLRLGW